VIRTGPLGKDPDSRRAESPAQRQGVCRAIGTVSKSTSWKKLRSGIRWNCSRRKKKLGERIPSDSPRFSSRSPLTRGSSRSLLSERLGKRPALAEEHRHAEHHGTREDDPPAHGPGERTYGKRSDENTHQVHHLDQGIERWSGRIFERIAAPMADSPIGRVASLRGAN